MKNLILALAASLAAASAASAASPKGVAAILLPNWKAGEADRLVKAVAESGVGQFEFSFWATYSGSNGYGVPVRVVNGLLAKNIKVRIRVYLGTIHDKAAHPNLAAQATAFNNALVVPYKNDARVSWRVCPALEDEYPDQATWGGAARTALGKIDTAAHPRLKMVRCTTQTRTGGQITIPATVNAGSGAVKCESECHWTPRAGSVGYSNDGQFVYIGNELFQNSATPFTGTKTLAAFKADGGSVSGAQLLWRPSYNLHGSNGAPANRIFDGSVSLADRLRNQKPAFDTYELEVLKSFLR